MNLEDSGKDLDISSKTLFERKRECRANGPHLDPTETPYFISDEALLLKEKVPELCRYCRTGYSRYLTPKEVNEETRSRKKLAA